MVNQNNKIKKQDLTGIWCLDDPCKCVGCDNLTFICRGLDITDWEEIMRPDNAPDV